MASPSAFPQRPRVFLTCAWECARRWFGYSRCGCGAGRVTGRALERGRDEARPTPRPLPPTDVHKLYERVVASYLKNRAS